VNFLWRLANSLLIDKDFDGRRFFASNNWHPSCFLHQGSKMDNSIVAIIKRAIMPLLYLLTVPSFGFGLA
jgi:hypothetical protein